MALRSGVQQNNQSDDAAFAPFEPQAFLASVDGQIMAVKHELEKLLDHLCRQTGGVRVQAAQDANITGVGLGAAGPTATACALGDPVLEVYTLQPESEAVLCARLASVVGDATLADPEFPIHVVHTGIIRAQQHSMRLRPAPGGVGCGHLGITAGTLGCLVRGRSAPRNERLMVLSNNHVLAAIPTPGLLAQPSCSPAPPMAEKIRLTRSPSS